MIVLSYIAAVALITRMDGYGPQAGDPAWLTPVGKAFNLYTCGALVGVLTALVFSTPIGGLITAGAWMLWRAPAFKDYGSPAFIHWPEMFARAALTSLFGFLAISLYATHTFFGGILFIPMGVAQMLLYNGFRRLVNDQLDKYWYFQIVAEAGTGAVFAAFTVLLFSLGCLPSDLGEHAYSCSSTFAQERILDDVLKAGGEHVA